MLFESFFVFVCIYNIFYQAMTDDIARIEFDNTYAFDVFQQSYRATLSNYFFIIPLYAKILKQPIDNFIRPVLPESPLGYHPCSVGVLTAYREPVSQ